MQCLAAMKRGFAMANWHEPVESLFAKVEIPIWALAAPHLLLSSARRLTGALTGACGWVGLEKPAGCVDCHTIPFQATSQHARIFCVLHVHDEPSGDCLASA